MADFYQQSQQQRNKNEYYSGRATDDQEPYDPRLGPAYGESNTKRSGVSDNLYHDGGDDFLDQRNMSAGRPKHSQSTVMMPHN